jgi:hypothetical protein
MILSTQFAPMLDNESATTSEDPLELALQNRDRARRLYEESLQLLLRQRRQAAEARVDASEREFIWDLIPAK